MRGANLVEPPEEQVEVGDYLVELVPAKHLVDELHLLDVGEEVPVVDHQVSRNLTSRVLGERGGWFLQLVGQGRLRGRGRGA